ncbi:MAG: ATP phosphoribosyltransferase [Planctomycetes bacterium]|jgi:ATP phosphoribosyltransferase|nr:ATP phosphoribosyltransferase [Planctomycetota bacterium]MCL4728969.1 ATP phosphoribosyltransferase [Planctomycetota bacterium]
MLRMALPTGRVLKEAQRLLAAAGLSPAEDLSATRRLTVPSRCGRVEYLLVKPVDAPLYVEQGVADCGISGKDTLMELSPDLLEPLDLGFARCRLVVAGKPELERKGDNLLSPVRIASKYPRVATNYFRKKGVPATVFKLSGSVEIGAVLGLSHYIVDIVETGATLRENGLVVIEEIAACSARLVVNRAAYYARLEEIRELMQHLANATGATP